MHELNQKPNFHLRNRFQNLATKLLITFQTPDRKFKKTFLIKPCRIKICYPIFIHAEEKKCFCTHQSFEIASSLSSNFHSRSAPFNLQRFVNLVFLCLCLCEKRVTFHLAIFTVGKMDLLRMKRG